MTTPRPRLANHQQPLIQCLLSSNHTNDDSGVCWGVAMKGMLAILSDTLDIFDRTLERIYESDPSSLAKVIHTYHSENDKQISSFLDSISLFQSPGDHEELFLPTHRLINQRTSTNVLFEMQCLTAAKFI